MLNLVQSVLLIRYLGKNEYGIWSEMLAIPATFIVLTDMGLNGLMLRAIARDQSSQNAMLSRVLGIKVFLAFCFMGGLYAYSYAFDFSSNLRNLLLLASLAQVVSILKSTIFVVYRALQQFGFQSILMVVESALMLCVVLALVLNDARLTHFFIAIIIINLLITSYVCINYIKVFELSVRIPGLIECFGILKKSLPFLLYELLNPLFYQIDVLMLARLSTYGSVGIYNAPYKVITGLFILPGAIKKALFPNLSKSYGFSKKEYSNTFQIVTKYVGMVGVPLGAATFVFSDKIVRLLFGQEFLASADVLKIMAIMLPCHYLRIQVTTALYAANAEKKVVSIFVLVVILNIILDYVFIPRWDFIGAAYASLISEVIFLATGAYFLRELIIARACVGIGLRLIMATAAMVAVIFLVGLLELSVIVRLTGQFVAGAIAYFILIRSFKVISDEEWAKLMALSRRVISKK